MTKEQLLEVSKIALLNDKFRKSGCGIVLTNGAQSVEDLPGLLQAIRNYNDFNASNDSWGERDFGSLVWYGDKVFWKIDYYDQNLKYWEEPTSDGCKRVMTIMLAEEY